MWRMAVATLAVLGMGQAPEDPQRGTEAWRAMKRRIAYDRVRVRFLRDEEASILAGLRQIEEQLDVQRAEVARLARNLEQVEQRLERLERQSREAENALASLRRRAGLRAAAMHRLRRTSVAQLVARIEDPSGARRLRDRFRYVLTYDRTMLLQARAVREQIRAARDGLLRQSEAKQRTRALLEQEVDDRSMLEVEREALLEAVREERETAERLVRELRDAAKQLEEEMSRIRGRGPAPPPLPGGFAAQRGRLPWPVSGRVEVAFGKKVDPGSDVVLLSKGIDVRAPLSAPIRAVYPGRVVFAGRFEGFGRMLVLAHDGGFFSLYAHLESFAVRLGTEVTQYQVLGYVGDSGSVKGPYLYFELRRGREAVDPLEWLTNGG